MTVQPFEPIYTKEVTDFYNTVHMITFENKQKALIGYNGLIATIDGNKASLYKKHLDEIELTAFKEFLRQNLFEVGGLRVKELKEKYGVY